MKFIKPKRIVEQDYYEDLQETVFGLLKEVSDILKWIEEEKLTIDALKKRLNKLESRKFYQFWKWYGKNS